jgi:hypothetical protein
MKARAREGPRYDDRGTKVSATETITVRGRAFSAAEIRIIETIVDASPDDHRFALSKKVCRALGWYQANGRTKDRACRDVLSKLHTLGLINLPPARRPGVRRRPIPITVDTDPRQAPVLRPRDIDSSCYSVVTGAGNPRRECLWNEFVERYHDLGFGVPLGSHIKYFVEFSGQPIACLAFGGAAWRLQARDTWIGWSDEDRARRLPLVVNNTRFLILPWIRIPNLASRLLSLATRRVPADWQQLYAYRPVLLETFVDVERHSGICYRAANWRHVGYTKGRGRMDRHFQAGQSRKAVLLYPLVDNAAHRLRTY